MTTNFVAKDGDKSAYHVFILCAGILQRFDVPEVGRECLSYRGLWSEELSEGPAAGEILRAVDIRGGRTNRKVLPPDKR